MLHGTSPWKVPGVLTARPYKLDGFEIFPGIGTPISRTTRYGATFVGTEKGGTSITLIGWVNYTPIFFKPNTECTVVGGRWWLLAREGTRYRGVLYGSFGEGKVRWNKDAKLAEASVRLKVSGGTRVYRNTWRAGSFTAALNHLPFPPRIGGTLKLVPDRDEGRSTRYR